MSIEISIFLIKTVRNENNVLSSCSVNDCFKLFCRSLGGDKTKRGGSMPQWQDFTTFKMAIIWGGAPLATELAYWNTSKKDIVLYWSLAFLPGAALAFADGRSQPWNFGIAFSWAHTWKFHSKLNLRAQIIFFSSL